MKKRFAAVLTVALVLGLVGCRLEHNSKVKYSQLTGEITTVDAVARVEVPSCHDYRDKTQPSKELSQTTDLMAKLFAGSEFEGCKQENMESMATYTVPMEVGAIQPDGKEPNPKGVAILRNGNGETFFFIAKDIRERITKARKDAMASQLALLINVKLTNNTEKEVAFLPHALFANGIACAGLPRWGQTIKIPPQKNVTLTLSNVSSEFAIANGAVPVFTEIIEQPGAAKK